MIDQFPENGGGNKKWGNILHWAMFGVLVAVLAVSAQTYVTRSVSVGWNTALADSSDGITQALSNMQNAPGFVNYGPPDEIRDLLNSLPNKAHSPAKVKKVVGPLAGATLPPGFSPDQLRHAYGFDQITFNNGLIQGDGSGQTIALIEAYDHPNIASDLAVFDTTFNLPAPPNFTKVGQTGGAPPTATDQAWALETSLDVQWAHAMAPGANILLVEANDNGWGNLFTAVDYARRQPGVVVVSMSFGGSEWSGMVTNDGYFTTPAGHAGVAFVASTGDSGAAQNYPAASPNIIGVGGTALNIDSLGTYIAESGWNGSGGGMSAYESQPSYQNGVVTQTTTKRAIPDVAYNASSSSPIAVYDTFGYGGWVQAYGTSGGAPQWASLIAIANQGRALAGLSALDGRNQILPNLYSAPQTNYHDITSGSNGGYVAGPGYDLVTGRGTPMANLVVNDLVGVVSSADNNPPSAPTGLSASNLTSTGVTLTWNTSTDNVGVVGYNIMRNGTKLASGASLSYSDLSLASCTTYSYTISAYDAAGNTSNNSSTLSVKTLGCVADTTPPVITISSPKDGSVLTAKGNTSIKANATDVSGIKVITISMDGALLQTCQGVTTCSVNVNNNKVKPGGHTIVVSATDKASPENTASAKVTIIK